jgi:hypothetical protein
MISPHCHKTLVIPRAKGASRKSITRPCSTCGKPFSAREMRKHAADCKPSAAVTDWRSLYDKGALPAWKRRSSASQGFGAGPGEPPRQHFPTICYMAVERSRV